MKTKLFTTCFLLIFLIVLSNLCFSKTNDMAKNIFGKDWVLRKDLPVISEPKIESLQANGAQPMPYRIAREGLRIACR